jgi:hypothetical protein
VRALLQGAPEWETPWRELVGQLLDFHRRETKPEWWAMFHRQDMSEAELIEDAECIGALESSPDSPPFPDKRSIVTTARGISFRAALVYEGRVPRRGPGGSPERLAWICRVFPNTPVLLGHNEVGQDLI